ncbi:uncharacterized protein A4U43_C05F3620 [Asparagus officinalis]|uniref:rRNA N-glycosylase n=1 Tax=Asparagus officinalis TaxID=4686 RepID=A0A5P1EQ40_ASPOF|nr:uncharacterized protein LOC109843536 [Asparagus officinalis]ONK67773.1 uncharacterized protein A4U43_C05F3620 [Asparagus officinalis]
MEASEIKSIELSLSYDLTAGNYVSKIEKMRQENAATWCRNRPVLPTVLNEKDPGFLKNLTWYDVVLDSDGGKTVRLRIRRDQLYLQGFLVNGKWFELGDQHLIADDSTLLPYGHNYTSLLSAAGIEITAGLTKVTFGREKLIYAAQSLQDPTSDVKKSAQALLVMIGMFCESARFIPISSYFRRTWQESKNAPDWVDKLVHRWGTLSGCCLFYDADPTYKWVPQTLEVEGPPPNYNPVKVEAKTMVELLEYLGILQRDPATIVAPKAQAVAE